MISLQKWRMLIEKWEEFGEVYQIPKRSKERLRNFCEVCLPHLKDKKVVEIGCNAGIFGLNIDQVAKSYIGVEPANIIRDNGKGKAKADYFKQLEVTQKEMKNGTIRNETITDYCKNPGDIDAFVACFALYHFRDHELELLKEHVFPKCDTIIIQNRTQSRATKRNSHKFYKDKNIIRFFNKQGFDDITVLSFRAKNGMQKFSEIIIKRNHARNKSKSEGSTPKEIRLPTRRSTPTGQRRQDQGSSQPLL